VDLNVTTTATQRPRNGTTSSV